jgi:cytidylate kinase
MRRALCAHELSNSTLPSAERDLRDSTRQVAPLKPAPDAQLLDSTGLSIDDVVERVLSLGRERKLWQ